ncbi:dihydropteroate synthase [Rufibacter glacialis]|uniref:dihydropteroate synthase n=2 Tax=Rufibacter glacialis TaxID=1259555 RepID=A0ABV4REU7_9BACT|nr:dihydropteroate synthase [Rufibacter glacialis]GGK76892.1 dihydropteroate synthase [Rufibacter glacialis]
MKAKDTPFYKKITLNCGGRIVLLQQPAVMGILNFTPDSFYANSRMQSVEQAVAQAGKMLNEGATFLDIGGYSTRPGAPEVTEQEELNRVIPIIEALSKAYPEALLSIDTFRARVAEAAVRHGAHLINDVSGGTLDQDMFATAGRLQVPYLLMHMRGTPQDMASQNQYPNGLVEEMVSFFAERVAQLRALGVKDILLDPGFGFAKDIDQNYQVLRRLKELEMFGLPLLIGLSRKSMTYKPLKVGPEEALTGTIVANTLALLNGADILRVHDVKEAVHTIKIAKKMLTA